MKNVYETPMLIFSLLGLEDVLTASFTKEEEGDGDRIGIKDLKI